MRLPQQSYVCIGPRLVFLSSLFPENSEKDRCAGFGRSMRDLPGKSEKANGP